MYNRYIPQPDGTFLRNRVEDPASNQRMQQAASEKSTPPPQFSPALPPKPSMQSHCPPQGIGLGNFFRQLLPRGIDTADLLILLLLLLMAGENEEDRNNALLTMALYFFM